MMPRFKSQTPIYAGVILLVNGIMGIGSLLFVNLYVSVLFPQYASEFAFYSAIVGGLSIFVLLGGAMTMTRKAWGLCLAASIAGVILSLFGVLCGVLGLMLSVTGVIFIIFAKKEFE